MPSQQSKDGAWDPLWTSILKEPKGPFISRYKRLFSIGDIEQSTVLQWFCGALLFMLSVAFAVWVRNVYYSREAFVMGYHSCWPYFQQCGKLLFLSGLHYGYSQALVYSVFFAMLILCVLFMARKNWVATHLSLMVFFVWALLVLFIFTNREYSNYWYFMMVFLFVFLFFPHKLFFLRISLVLFYFLAASVKLSETWILGTYFTSLAPGFPLFPDALTPLFTNLVIVMEMVGAWFLLSSKKMMQRGALIYFILFHIYSYLLVLNYYPSVILPALLILFGPMNMVMSVPRTKAAVIGWLLLLPIVGVDMVSIAIPGDVRYTLEGNLYGTYMFEANHQCVLNATLYGANGKLLESIEQSSITSTNRCDPYNHWFRFNERCARDRNVSRIRWTFDHSIDGGPFYRIVDEDDACSTEYKVLSHNGWIRIPPNASISGYPVKNIFWNLPSVTFDNTLGSGRNKEIKHTSEGYLVLPGLEGQQAPKLNKLQQVMVPFTRWMKIFYWALWTCVFIFLLSKYVVPSLFFGFKTTKK